MENNYDWQNDILLDDAHKFKIIRAARSTGKTHLAIRAAQKGVIAGKNVVYYGHRHVFTQMAHHLDRAYALGHFPARPMCDDRNMTFTFINEAGDYREYGTIRFVPVNPRQVLPPRYSEWIVIDDKDIPYSNVKRIAERLQAYIWVIGTHSEGFVNRYMENPYFKYYEYNYLDGLRDGAYTEETIEKVKRYYEQHMEMFKDEFGPWRKNVSNRQVAHNLQLI